MTLYNKFIRSCKITTGPLGILPLLLLMIYGVPRIYTPQEITELQQVPLILQGDTDFGGSNIYAAVVKILFLFGATGSFYLSLSLPYVDSFKKAVVASFKLLTYHFIVFSIPFILYGFGALSLYFPCETFSVFTVALIFYLLSIGFITWLTIKRVSFPLRLALAPLVIALWFFLSLDGTTFKAGQIVSAYQIPKTHARSFRHAIVTAPQRFCPKVPFLRE